VNVRHEATQEDEGTGGIAGTSATSVADWGRHEEGEEKGT